MDSRTIYVGHREPPPGAEAYIPQRFPDNRIVSSKVVVFSFINLHKSAQVILRVFIYFLQNFLPIFPMYFSFTVTGKGETTAFQVSSMETNCQIASNMNRKRITSPLFTIIHRKALE